MKQLTRPRKAATFSGPLERRLNWYAIAASAAGVSMLALAQPADAKIIYTKAKDQILGGARLQLDLNHDGVNDFFFKRNSSAHFTSSLLVYTKIFLNDIWGTQSHELQVASALPPGARVGPSKRFSPGFIASSGNSWGRVMCKDQVCGTQTQTCSTHKFGQWGQPIGNRYLGLQFKVKSKTHYGWARISSINGEYTLTGYAYETIPDKAIIAGKTEGPDVLTVQPGSLGNPARGASAIPAGRAIGGNQ